MDRQLWAHRSVDAAAAAATDRRLRKAEAAGSNPAGSIPIYGSNLLNMTATATEPAAGTSHVAREAEQE